MESCFSFSTRIGLSLVSAKYRRYLSHKQGSGPVTNLDGDGINEHLITDIKTADRGIYTVLIGYFEVGKCIE